MMINYVQLSCIERDVSRSRTDLVEPLVMKLGGQKVGGPFRCIHRCTHKRKLREGVAGWRLHHMKELYLLNTDKEDTEQVKLSNKTPLQTIHNTLIMWFKP